MSKAAKLDTLEALHAKVAEVITKALDDDPSPQMIAQGLKFLKDNGIEPARDADNQALTALSERIAAFSQDDDAVEEMLN